MIAVHFKNVGQGDSIIIEWSKNGEKNIGIIDCNLYEGRNPTLDYIKRERISKIEFIILSHFHFDHFSGMSDIFEYCCLNKISVKYFYHSLAPFLAEIYNRIFTSQKIQNEVRRFVEKYDSFDNFVIDTIPVNSQTKKLELLDNTFISFLAPQGRIYNKMAKQLARKRNKITTTKADVNKLSTIVLIENETNSILFTSDSVKKSFKNINVTTELVLVQVPHHGSINSIDNIFWKNLKRIPKCPAIFSVGDEPKDKLPNEETVRFFDLEDFDVYSTNQVYGINSYFKLGLSTEKNPGTSVALNTFSKLRSTNSLSPLPKYNGDQVFNIL